MSSTPTKPSQVQPFGSTYSGYPQMRSYSPPGQDQDVEYDCVPRRKRSYSFEEKLHGGYLSEEQVNMFNSTIMYGLAQPQTFHYGESENEENIAPAAISSQVTNKAHSTGNFCTGNGIKWHMSERESHHTRVTSLSSPKNIAETSSNEDERHFEFYNKKEILDSFVNTNVDENTMRLDQNTDEERGELDVINETSVKRDDPICSDQFKIIFDNLDRQLRDQYERAKIRYDDNRVCDVCRRSESLTGNVIVSCEKCEVAVHQKCYGIVEIPERDWLCQRCAFFGSSSSKTSCALCPEMKGAMKKVCRKKDWVHMNCAIWIPGVEIGNIITMQPITHLQNIEEKRRLLKCYLCKRVGGVCIQCSTDKCFLAYHVTCAYNKDLDMSFDLTSVSNGVSYFESHCRRHSKRKLSRTFPEEAIVNPRSLLENYHHYVDKDKTLKELDCEPAFLDIVFKCWLDKRNKGILGGFGPDGIKSK